MRRLRKSVISLMGAVLVVGATLVAVAPTASAAGTALAPQTIVFTSAAPTGAVVGGPTYTPMASGGASGNPVIFSIDASATSVCSITSGVVTFTGTGSCVIDANQAGNADFSPAPQVQQKFAVVRGAQTIVFTSAAPTGALVGGPTYTPMASGGASGNAVVLSIDASATSVCSITSGVVTFTGVGSCVIDANQAGNVNYNPAAQVQQTVPVGRGAQTIVFTSAAPTGALVGGPTYTPTASGGGSGNAVIFSIDASATSVCSITSGVVTFTGAGSCVIDANQAGNANFNAAAQVQQAVSVVAVLGSQTISFTSIAPTGAVVGGPTYTPMATGGASGNAVIFSIDASATSVCSITSGGNRCRSPRLVRVSLTPIRPATRSSVLRLRCSRPFRLVRAPRPLCSPRSLLPERWWAGLLTRRWRRVARPETRCSSR